MRAHLHTLLSSPFRLLVLALPLAFVACAGDKGTSNDDSSGGDEGGDDGGGDDGGGDDGGSSGGDSGGDSGGSSGGDSGGSSGGDSGGDSGGSSGGDSGGGSSGGGGTDADRDGYDSDEDCDDGDADVYPGADEVCDDKDNDCDDDVDEDPTDGDYYAPDDDGDGLGAAGELVLSCDGVTNAWDCNDADAHEPQVVDDDASSGGTGSYGKPWDTIQEGIDEADECVLVLAGEYNESIDFSGKDITVLGLDGSAATVINAEGLVGPVVTFANGESTDAKLIGFTLTGGVGHLEETSDSYSCGSGDTCTNYYSTWCGGGIYIDGASPSLEALLIVENTLEAASSSSSGDDTYYTYSFGGGLCLLNASPLANQVHVWENYADQGGGVYVDEDSVLEQHASVIGGNAATDGGGYAVDGGALILVNVLGVWNEATEDGGAVLGMSGGYQIINATLAGNSSPLGGGIQLTGTADATVMNSIIYASITGYGVIVQDTAKFNGSYNDVYDNADGEFGGMSDPAGTDGNISADPKFTDYSADGDPTNDDYTLSASSPAVDAGNPSSSYNDADGSTNDMGVYGGPDSSWASGS